MPCCRRRTKETPQGERSVRFRPSCRSSVNHDRGNRHRTAGWRAPAAGRRVVPGGRGGPDRPGGPERSREDHAGQGAGRGGPAGRGLGPPFGHGRVPAAGSRAPGTWTRWPSTGCCRPAGSTSSAPTCARPRPRWPTPTPAPRPRPSASTAGWRSGSRCSAGTRRNRRPPRSPPAWACPTGCCTSRCTPCPAASGAGWSWPGSCSPIPGPCCWTSRPTTWTPTRWSGSAITSRATAAAWW